MFIAGTHTKKNLKITKSVNDKTKINSKYLVFTSA